MKDTRSDTLVEAPRVLPEGGRSGRHRVRRRGRVLRFIGSSSLLVAFLLAAWISWILWGTGLFTAQEQSSLRDEIAGAIEDPARAAPIVPGAAYAVLQIPAMDLNAVVVEGTDVEVLKKGPGHYSSTDDPWDRGGRVGIAGHRTTYGAPFWDLDVLEKGDAINLWTAREVFRYEVSRIDIVSPAANEILKAPPDAGGGVRIGPGSSNRGLGPDLVLTTCHPKFSAAQRLVAYAEPIPPPAPGEARTEAADTAEEVIGAGGAAIDGPTLVRWVKIAVAVAAALLVPLMVIGWRGRRRLRVNGPRDGDV